MSDSIARDFWMVLTDGTFLDFALAAAAALVVVARRLSSEYFDILTGILGPESDGDPGDG